MSDQLQANSKLNVDDQLVSASGQYVLVMQGDGNLVLYHGAPAADTAYWASNTEWLPAEQRPVMALMQGDGNLVLYDANKVARWASGTWGGFDEPKAVLGDDGDLVISDKTGMAIWASGGVGGVGAIPSRGFVAAPGLNFGVDACGRLPAVVSGSTDLAPPVTDSVDVNGVAYLVTEQRRRLVNDVIEQSFLQDLAELGVWPGQVIQGRGLLAGDLSPIGPLPRQPGTVEVTTDLVTGMPGQSQSAVVQHPAGDAVDQARRDILTALNPQDSPGLLKADYQSATTYREVGVNLGVQVKGSTFGVDANATLNETHKQSTVVAVIRQVFYNVTFSPNGPQATGFWADGANGVSIADLQPYMGTGNPPLYIDSVQYGRFICVTAEGAHSSSDITAAVKAHFDGAVSGSTTIDLKTQELLESCTMKIFTLGVPGINQFNDIANPVNDLAKVYTSGLKFNPNNPGAPISFTCRHIADNSLAHVGLTADYIQPLSAVGADVTDAKFQVFDGPGGGLVDTHIIVNSGDMLTIQAGGAIRNGVFASGDTTPDGWPGHKADAAAPMPSGTAYCLVARLGNNPYFEAKSFWQNTIPAGQSGTLALVENDNDLTNGDPHKQWTVHVDVKRADAAAASVFV